MIPPSPTSLTTMPATKAKIGFSIDSIVGNDDTTKTATKDSNHIKSDFKHSNDHYQTEIARALRLTDSIGNGGEGHIKLRTELNNGKDTIRPNLFEYPMKRESSTSPISYKTSHSNLPSDEAAQQTSRSPSPHRTSRHNNNNNNSSNNNNNSNSNLNSNSIETNETLPFVNGIHSGAGIGPIRPLPIVPPNLVETKTMPYLGLNAAAAAAAAAAVGHPSPHLLQFQMTAAFQRQAAEQSFVAGAPFRHTPPPPPHLMGPGMPRDSYQLYPWLLSRHGRIFPHGFPGNFLLHPFRKPKRVRTAFSPGQLLKLEHAFESNQYVVGAERKALAQALNLSETQVKVWFQNRRTKHKRMQQEDDSKGDGSHSNSGNDGTRHSYDDDEDEMIDMEDCSDEYDDEHHPSHGLPH